MNLQDKGEEQAGDRPQLLLDTYSWSHVAYSKEVDMSRTYYIILHHTTALRAGIRWGLSYSYEAIWAQITCHRHGGGGVGSCYVLAGMQVHSTWVQRSCEVNGQCSQRVQGQTRAEQPNRDRGRGGKRELGFTRWKWTLKLGSYYSYYVILIVEDA